MKIISPRLLTAVVLLTATAVPLRAATNETASVKSSEATEAAYTQAIEKRVADILAVLELKEPSKMKNVHDTLVAQYRTLRDWHDAHDASRKAAKGQEVEQFKASLKAIHDKFIAALGADLTPGQVEQVKDKMTYGKVQFTYAGYLTVHPDLTEPHKQKILELLKEAREEAMDGGSSEEKSAIFNRYKGKINNYLSAQGVSVGKKKKPDAVPTNAPTTQ